MVHTVPKPMQSPALIIFAMGPFASRFPAGGFVYATILCRDRRRLVRSCSFVSSLHLLFHLLTKCFSSTVLIGERNPQISGVESSVLVSAKNHERPVAVDLVKDYRTKQHFVCITPPLSFFEKRKNLSK